MHGFVVHYWLRTFSTLVLQRQPFWFWLLATGHDIAWSIRRKKPANLETSSLGASRYTEVFQSDRHFMCAHCAQTPKWHFRHVCIVFKTAGKIIWHSSALHGNNTASLLISLRRSRRQINELLSLGCHVSGNFSACFFFRSLYMYAYALILFRDPFYFYFVPVCFSGCTYRLIYAAEDIDIGRKRTFWNGLCERFR